jgi:lipopolysaccharide cholinephosphotransferase
MTTYSGGQASENLLRLQRVLSRMTAELFDWCGQRGLTMFLVAGSALGAVRDGAIIPWDDDIDLGLERSDYDRFVALFAADPIPGMIIQSWQTAPDYPHSFAKIRLDGTRISDTEFEGKDLHQGIFVDIFPYDSIPQNRVLEAVQRYAIGLLNLFIERPAHEDPHGYFSRRRKLARMAARGLARLLPAPQRLARLRDWFLRMPGARKGDLVDCLGMFGTNAIHRTRIARSAMLPPIDGTLGDLAVKIPAQPDVYLMQMYRNWRELPPEPLRTPIHLTGVDFGGHPYARN